MAKEDFECGFCKEVFLIEDPQPGQEVRCPKCSRPNRIPEEDIEPEIAPTPAVENQVLSTTIKLAEVQPGVIYKTMSKVLFRVVSVEGNSVIVDMLEPCQIVLLADKEIEVERVEFSPLNIPVE